ncbi:outer membrane protein transport protein [bacterium]|nr:outer membrane protein transport protein [bacterium]
MVSFSKGQIWYGLILCAVFIKLQAAIDLTGIGCRAQSMGGNFRGVADDYSAMFWNPAGLSFQRGWHAGLHWTLVSQRSGYLAADSPLYQEKTNEQPDDASAENYAGLKQFSATFPYKAKSDVPVVLVPSTGVFYGNGKWAFGLGAWAAFGVRARYDLIGSAAYNQSADAFSGPDWEDDMKFIDMHPTVACRISDRLALGAGFSFIIADIYLRKPAFSPMNPFLTNEENNQLILEYIETLPADSRTALSQGLGAMNASPMDHLVADTYIEGSGTGFGYNVGFLYKVTDVFQVGASFQAYHDVPVEGEASVQIKYPYHPGVAPFLTDTVRIDNVAYEGLLKYYERMQREGRLDLRDRYLLSKYGSGAVEFSRDRDAVKSEMPLPKRMGIGFCYTGISRLMLTADIAVTTWSAWDAFEIRETDGTLFNTIEKDWKNVIRFGMGFEYDWTIFKGHGGFYTESRAAINETMVPTNPDVNRRNVVSLGLEVPYRRYRFHLNFEHTFMKDVDIKEWVVMPNQLDYKNMAGLYSASMTNIMMGLDVDL